LLWKDKFAKHHIFNQRFESHQRSWLKLLVNPSSMTTVVVG
jgi:hypothetical protein